MSASPEEMEQSAEIAFGKIPSRIRKIGFCGGYFRIGNCDGERLDLVVGRGHEDQHAHFFKENGAVVMQITNQLIEDKVAKYKRVNWQEFLLMLADTEQRFRANFEWITIEDSRYTGKDVLLSTLPKIEFVKVKKKKAYLGLVTEEEMSKFDDLDLSKLQIGAILEADGEELALIIIGKGRIASMPVTRLEELVIEFEETYRPKWNQ